MLSIFRWWSNPATNSPNKVISRTCGKIAFINHSFRGALPEPDQFWFCDIVAEVNPGQVSGCFVVEPYVQVPYEDLVLLTPSSCTISTSHNSVKGKGTVVLIDPVTLFTPEGKRIPWFFPLRQREKIRDFHIVSVVVNLGGKVWDPIFRT